MKNTTVFVILLVVFSAVLIAGCTEKPAVTTPAPASAVTAAPTNVVQNQGGVAIIKTQAAAVPANQTAAVMTNQTVAVPANQTAAVKTNQTVAVPANQTVPVKANLTAAMPVNKS